jgi:uroporphyrin-III C-methyltransferase
MKLSIPEVAAGPIAAALALSFASFLAGAAWARRGAAAAAAGGAPPCVCPAAAAAPLPRPSITLVGGGPGAPDLITLAGLSALRAADVVITDLIAAAGLRALAPAGCVFHVADKVPGNADSAQASVNAIGLAALREGKRVVRLKVGDPFLYGRGGEECEFFRAHGFEARVVPGVSAALAAPICAGIPVTHRGAANQLLISTGQGRGGAFPDLPRWEPSRTLVLLMAVGRAGKLRADLCDERGYPEDTPVAVIERGTHPDERVTRTTLAGLAAAAEVRRFESPAVMVVGRVVAFGQPTAVGGPAED